MRIILGPTRILQEDSKDREFLLAVLGVAPEERGNYLRLLRSAPIISADRFAWLLASLETALYGQAFPAESVWFSARQESGRAVVQAGDAQQRLDVAGDDGRRQTVAQSYAWEELVTSYVENGQTEPLRDLLSAPPNITAGRIAHDGLRQAKNLGICTAATLSRAAIRGGLDPRQAFGMSDLYIQRLELLHSVTAVERLTWEMALDFAAQVETLRRSLHGESLFYRMCARYVSEHLFTPVRAEEMAQALGDTRAYLCARFRQEAGLSLSQYIQQEKTAEAKRLLQFTDQTLGQIAAMLAYSSQSHFQAVFHRVAGETPLAYRRRTRLPG